MNKNGSRPQDTWQRQEQHHRTEAKREMKRTLPVPGRVVSSVVDGRLFALGCVMRDRWIDTPSDALSRSSSRLLRLSRAMARRG